MRGIRLHPNYHGDAFADPLAARVLERAANLGLLVQSAVIREEERTSQTRRTLNNGNRAATDRNNAFSACGIRTEHLS